jgi:hypothetical protein
MDMLMDIMVSIIWAKDLLSLVIIMLLTLMPHTVIMVMDMLMDTMVSIIWAKDPLSPVITMLPMLMVMATVTMVIMDIPMDMASKFILLT